MVYLYITLITTHLLSKFNKQEERKFITLIFPVVDPFKLQQILTGSDIFQSDFCTLTC